MSEATQMPVRQTTDILDSAEIQIREIENKLLQGMMACRSSEADCWARLIAMLSEPPICSGISAEAEPTAR